MSKAIRMLARERRENGQVEADVEATASQYRAGTIDGQTARAWLEEDGAFEAEIVEILSSRK